VPKAQGRELAQVSGGSETGAVLHLAGCPAGEAQEFATQRGDGLQASSALVVVSCSGAWYERPAGRATCPGECDNCRRLLSSVCLERARLIAARIGSVSGDSAQLRAFTRPHSAIPQLRMLTSPLELVPLACGDGAWRVVTGVAHYRLEKSQAGMKLSCDIERRKPALRTERGIRCTAAAEPKRGVR